MPFRIFDSCLLGVAANRAWELLEHPEKSPWNGMLSGRREGPFPDPGVPGAGLVGFPLGPAPRAPEPPPPAPESPGAGPVGLPLIPTPEAPELEEEPEAPGAGPMGLPLIPAPEAPKLEEDPPPCRIRG